MPPPPPPPPPGPPPPPAPPPPSGFLASAPSKSKPADRNALLAEIRTGTRLKKAVTNDKSAPIIDGKPRVANGSGGGGSIAQPKLNGPGTGPMMMGNIFAQGMPKLRQTGNRPVGAFSASRSENSEVTSTKNEPSEPPEGSKFNLSHSASPNSVLPPPSSTNGSGTSLDAAKPHFPAARRPSFPNDVVMKGPPPAPPPASQKPNFASLNDSTSLTPAGHQRNRSGPPLPSKPPGGVARSNSQTNLGPKTAKPRPPPSVKPPPPPKSPSTVKNGPPAPPSKPPSITRRQSLGSHDIKNGILPNQLSTHMEVPIITPSTKLNVPPPPPRNFSAPNSLNQLHTSGGSPHPPSSLATNRSAPPPPPPPPQSAKSSVGVSRSSSVRPPPPPPPPVPPGAPSSAPPPPPHRSTYPAPPSQMKAVPQSVPPPPPLRNASTRQGSAVDDFESRFLKRFHSVHEFPQPDRFTNSKKTYCSKSNQFQRRNPPPPPPGGNAGSQPNLHLQLDSKMFPSNTAQC